MVKEQRAIVAQVKKYVPLMTPFFELPQTLQEYSANLQHFTTHRIHRGRQQLISAIITRKVQQLFGSQAISNLRLSLSDKLAFNITDHHQVLNHPLLIGDNLVSSVQKFMQPKKQDAIVVISSGENFGTRK